MPLKTIDLNTLPKQNFSALYEKINYSFHDETLIMMAMMHPSFDKESKVNNQRLEFLGDAILNSIITEQLFYDFPKEREGTLTRFRSWIVRKESLAFLARSLHLNDYLLLGAGERKQHPEANDSMLADALEALIAALYIDSDFLTCKTVVLPWFENQIESMPSKKRKAKDFKTFLQEYLQKQKQPLPVYETTFNKKAAPEKRHSALCLIEGMKGFKGYGPSRQKAEQAAAKAAIQQMKIN